LSEASFHNRTIALAIRDVGEDPCGLRLPLKIYSKSGIKRQVVAFSLVSFFWLSKRKKLA